MQILNMIIQYWYVLVGLVALILYAINQRSRVLEWLKIIVYEAEDSLGSGTGQLKLRQAYDAFIEQFPFFSMIITFRTFSRWVDIALGWLKEQIENNVNVKYLLGIEK